MVKPNKDKPKSLERVGERQFLGDTPSPYRTAGTSPLFPKKRPRKRKAFRPEWGMPQ